MRLNDIDGALLERAIRHYLSLAYSGGIIPERIQSLLLWKMRSDDHQLWSDERFEICDSELGPRHFLRLGNQYYPHMKLGIVPCTGCKDEYVFVADSHDRHFEISDDQPDAELFRSIQRKNETLKGQIEERWQKEGIPTSHSITSTFFFSTGNFKPLNAAGLNILIVDDTPATLQLERIILEKHGFNVIECNDGAGVLEVAKTREIDAGIIDIMMPGMDGYQVVTRLEQLGLRQFPIAFSTAMRMEEVRTGIADAYIPKPFSPSYFIESLQSMLRTSRKPVLN